MSMEFPQLNIVRNLWQHNRAMLTTASFCETTSLVKRDIYNWPGKKLVSKMEWHVKYLLFVAEHMKFHPDSRVYLEFMNNSASLNIVGQKVTVSVVPKSAVPKTKGKALMRIEFKDGRKYECVGDSWNDLKHAIKHKGGMMSDNIDALLGTHG